MRTLNEVIHSLRSTFAHARMRDGNDDLSRRFMCISNCRGGSSIYAILSLFICKKVWEIWLRLYINKARKFYWHFKARIIDKFLVGAC